MSLPPEHGGGAAGEPGPRRLRRAEEVLRRRTGRVLLVLERGIDGHNHEAALRTAEGFGVQHVWIIDAKLKPRRPSKKVTRGAWRWLSLRRFPDTASCLAALRQAGRTIWATDLSRDAEPLQRDGLALPDKLALVIGREADGVSREMLDAAARRVYLPMHGFTESFNLSVATALLLHLLLDACPEARGDLPAAERAALRALWYRRLASSPEQAQEFAGWLERPPPPLEELRPPPEHRVPRARKECFPSYFQRPFTDPRTIGCEDQ